MKPQTPENIPLLSDFLKTHPNQKFVANLTAVLSQGFWAGYQGNHFSKQPKTFPEPINIPYSLKKTSWKKLNLAALQAPLKSPHFPNFQNHHLGLVPEKNSQNVKSPQDAMDYQYHTGGPPPWAFHFPQPRIQEGHSYVVTFPRPLNWG